MITTELQIINKLGLHARASSLFVQTASQFKSNITVTCRGNSINGKSILGLMMLAASQGTLIRIDAEGPDEQLTLNALINLVNNYFNEGE